MRLIITENPFGIIEQQRATGGQCIAMKNEAGVLLQGFDRSASRDEAIRLALGAGAEAGQPAEVAVRTRLHEEYLDLVMGDSEPGARSSPRRRP